ncbi:MAG TPA: RNase adapter RapZ [Clostridiaceae bacterium]|nr:RNase adapter RapZ [Clostridiaceae bacterium]
MRIFIITGISGAGKSLVANYLEDLGFFCVDNLPPSLIPKFAEVCFQSNGKMDKVALVIDIRGGELFNDLFPALETLKEDGFSYEILFMEASDNVLIKRFKESRRTHPLAPEGRLIKGIIEERQMLKKVKEKADHIIDTSNLTPRQLKEEIVRIIGDEKTYKGIIINIMSFGFKYGIPIDCDLVFDVRFIPNPYYINSMKKLTGRSEVVKNYVLKFEETTRFLDKLTDMLEFLIPNYVKEGKASLVIGIGCTGGRHRSVAIADELYQRLLEKQHSVIIEHRDIDKDNRGAGR